MSTAYHHGNLREALVAEAVEMVRQGGPDALALRELARRVGVSHNAAYRHFADRDALVAQVGAIGLARLAEAGARRMADLPVEDAVRAARRRLVELGRSYVDFAVGEPGLFRTAFASYPSLPNVPDDLHTGEDSFNQLGACLDGLVDVGYLDPAARPGSEMACWSAVHGLAMLFLEGPLQRTEATDRQQIVDLVLGTFDRSYGATTGSYDAPLPPLTKP